MTNLDLLDGLLLPGFGELSGIELRTKKNRLIRNIRKIEDSPIRLQVARAYVSEECDRAVCRSMSRTYNCLGLVFASRRTWVDDATLDRILEDDEYRPVTNEADLLPGDIAIYREPGTDVFSHIGMITRIDPSPMDTTEKIVWVLSQFGSGGEWIHPVDQVPPEAGKISEYCTERKMI